MEDVIDTFSYRDLTVRPARIAIEHFTHGWRYAAKIVPYGQNDGGFAVVLPNDFSPGLLARFYLRDTFSRKVAGRCYLLEEATVSRPVKMSFHVDGFTQFSEVERGTIISGKDASGVPRGLGISARPFKTPVISGAVFGVIFWGPAKFRKLSEKLAEIAFTRREIVSAVPAHIGPRRKGERDAIRLEGYLVANPDGLLLQGTLNDPRFSGYLWDGVLGRRYLREMRVVRLHNSDAALLIGVRRARVTFDEPSGYSIGTQRDLNNVGLLGFFPAGAVGGHRRSLDRMPDLIMRHEPGANGLVVPAPTRATADQQERTSLVEWLPN